MRINFEDFVLEQSLSDMNICDIELEQIKAEIEVTFAVIEAYMKQCRMDIYTEDDKSSSISSIVSTSSENEETGILETIKRFFIKIANWFRQMWIKFISYFSEKRLNGILNKLSKVTESDRQHFIGVSTLNKDDSDDFINDFVEMSKSFSDTIETLFDGEKFNERDLNYALKKMSNMKKHDNYANKNKTSIYSYNYDDYLYMVKKLVEAYNKNKDEMKKIKDSFKANKYEHIMDNMTGINEKQAKKIYKDINRLYTMFSSYSMTRMSIFSNTLKYAEKNLHRGAIVAPAETTSEDVKKTILHFSIKLSKYIDRIIEEIHASSSKFSKYNLNGDRMGFEKILKSYETDLHEIEYSVDENRIFKHQNISGGGLRRKDVVDFLDTTGKAFYQSMLDKSKKFLTDLFNNKNCNYDNIKDIDECIEGILDTAGIKFIEREVTNIRYKFSPPGEIGKYGPSLFTINSIVNNNVVTKWEDVMLGLKDDIMEYYNNYRKSMINNEDLNNLKRVQYIVNGSVQGTWYNVVVNMNTEIETIIRDKINEIDDIVSGKISYKLDDMKDLNKFITKYLNGFSRSIVDMIKRALNFIRGQDYVSYNNAFYETIVRSLKCLGVKKRKDNANDLATNLEFQLNISDKYNVDPIKFKIIDVPQKPVN